MNCDALTKLNLFIGFTIQLPRRTELPLTASEVSDSMYHVCFEMFNWQCLTSWWLQYLCERLVFLLFFSTGTTCAVKPKLSIL